MQFHQSYQYCSDKRFSNNFEGLPCQNVLLWGVAWVDQDALTTANLWNCSILMCQPFELAIPSEGTPDPTVWQWFEIQRSVCRVATSKCMHLRGCLGRTGCPDIRVIVIEYEIQCVMEECSSMVCALYANCSSSPSTPVLALWQWWKIQQLF